MNSVITVQHNTNKSHKFIKHLKFWVTVLHSPSPQKKETES